MHGGMLPVHKGRPQRLPQPPVLGPLLLTRELADALAPIDRLEKESKAPLGHAGVYFGETPIHGKKEDFEH
jgi:hypothetical protein